MPKPLYLPNRDRVLQSIASKPVNDPEPLKEPVAYSKHYYTKPAKNRFDQVSRSLLAMPQRILKVVAYGTAAAGFVIVSLTNPLVWPIAAIWGFRSIRRVVVNRDTLIARRAQANEKSGYWRSLWVHTINPEPFFHKALPKLAAGEVVAATRAVAVEPTEDLMAPSPKEEAEMSRNAISVNQPAIAPKPVLLSGNRREVHIVKARVKESPLLNGQGQQVPLYRFTKGHEPPVWLFNVAPPEGAEAQPGLLSMPKMTGLKDYLAQQKQLGRPIQGTILVATPELVHRFVIKDGSRLQDLGALPIGDLNELVRNTFSSNITTTTEQEAASTHQVQLLPPDQEVPLSDENMAPSAEELSSITASDWGFDS